MEVISCVGPTTANLNLAMTVPPDRRGCEQLLQQQQYCSYCFVSLEAHS
jgi:hypothetical protein